MPTAAEGMFGLVTEHGAGLIVTFVVAVMFIRLNARGSEVTGMT